MKLVRYVLAPLALILFAGAAHAQESDRSGWALNIGLGGGIVRDEDDTETFRGSAFAWKTGIEYRMQNSIALGFTVFDLGTAEDTVGGVETEVRVDGIDFHARFVFGSGGQTEFYGLLGGAIYDANVSTGGSSIFGDGAILIGGGVDFFTGERSSIRFEARYLEGDRNESGGYATLGFNFRF